MPQDFSLIKRTDGTQQYTYKNMPLYFHFTDTKPGDITGDTPVDNGIWHIVIISQ
jgi:predicted lipoprotein with Yx(FWY)xxD motif